MTRPRPPRRWMGASADWAWGGIGVSMATASAGFAAYMIATAPAEVVGFGSKDFNVFVHWDRRPQALAAVHAPAGSPRTLPAERPPAPDPRRAATPPVPPPATPPPAGLAAIDPEPTGSIPESGHQSHEARVTGPLGDFHLRDVFGDHALIEHRSQLSLVKPGSILAGAGEVLAIERQGRGWVVRTAAGVIGGT